MQRLGELISARSPRHLLLSTWKHDSPPSPPPGPQGRGSLHFGPRVYSRHWDEPRRCGYRDGDFRWHQGHLTIMRRDAGTATLQQQSTRGQERNTRVRVPARAARKTQLGGQRWTGKPSRSPSSGHVSVRGRARRPTSQARLVIAPWHFLRPPLRDRSSQHRRRDRGIKD